VEALLINAGHEGQQLVIAGIGNKHVMCIAPGFQFAPLCLVTALGAGSMSGAEF